jgi:MotA/TolQ/ExbB proton channel family
MPKNIYLHSQASPVSLIWKQSFWLTQKVFLIFVGISIILLFLAREYTYSQDAITSISNLTIHSLGILGIFFSVSFLAEIEVNTNIVEEIEYKGNEYLSNLHDNPRSRIDLINIGSRLIPDNKSDPKPAMVRLFQRIVLEAKDRRFESSIYLIQPYQDESYEKILLLTNLQKLALRLGILGTFIGLIIAIKDLTNKGGGEDVTKTITGLFSALYISFSTSVAGLEVAIFLGILLLILQKKQSKYFKKMEDAVLTMLSAVRSAVNKDEFLVEFQQLSGVTKELGDKVYDYNRSVRESVGSAEQKIVSLTTGIEQGLKQLSQSKTEFDGFLASISNTQKQFIDDLEHVYDVVSLKRISDELQRSIINAGTNVGNRVEQTKEKIDVQSDQIQQGVNGLSEINHKFDKFLAELNISQERFITELRKNHDFTTVNKVEKALNNNSTQIEKLARTINRNDRDSFWVRLRKLF